MLAWLSWLLSIHEKIIVVFNSFFNCYIRESESHFVHILWTTANLFGWVKIIIELKGLIEFFIRHIRWHSRWRQGELGGSQPTMASGSGIIRVFGAMEIKYGNGLSVTMQKYRNWAVITGASDGIGAEYAR